MIQELCRQREFGQDDLRPHARWLVRAARHREPLKLGILLLGLSGAEDDLSGVEGDLENLFVVARHDEFTLFAAIAIGKLLEDPTDVWLALAEEVHGWGKIHLVERLCNKVEDRPDLRAWLLRRGCANGVMPEYLAYDCAVSGRLLEALSEDEPEDELLDGACLIIRSMLNGGPAADIDSYTDGAPAVRSLLGHLEGRCDSLQHLDVVGAIVDWMEWPPPEREPDKEPAGVADGDEVPAEDDRWSGREGLGWTAGTRAELASRGREILGNPAWRKVVVAAFKSRRRRLRVRRPRAEEPGLGSRSPSERRPLGDGIRPAGGRPVRSSNVLEPIADARPHPGAAGVRVRRRATPAGPDRHRPRRRGGVRTG